MLNPVYSVLVLRFQRPEGERLSDSYIGCHALRKDCSWEVAYRSAFWRFGMQGKPAFAAQHGPSAWVGARDVMCLGLRDFVAWRSLRWVRSLRRN
jgi:hypothetical protein